MLRLSIEELTALNLLLKFMSVSELVNAAMVGYVSKDNPTRIQQEKSDICWKVLKTLN